MNDIHIVHNLNYNIAGCIFVFSTSVWERYESRETSLWKLFRSTRLESDGAAAEALALSQKEASRREDSEYRLAPSCFPYRVLCVLR